MLEQDMIINGRKRDLGGFTVARSIPSPKRRQVGPFVFLDHMGPLRIDATHALDVRPHPHIGLSTVTYLYDGQGHHRDSLGYSQIIKPGDLNWMTAGRGIVHSERSPEEDRDPKAQQTLHGLQIWVGLPVEHEECEPSFTHYPKELLPDFNLAPNLSGKLLIGSYGKVSSPVKTFSRTFFAELSAHANVQTQLGFEEQELAIFLVSGSAHINEQKLEVDDLIIVADPKKISINVSQGTKLAIIGGANFPEPRYIWWNFVSSQKEKIHAAAAKWKAQAFDKVPGETEFTPLPNDPLP